MSERHAELSNARSERGSHPADEDLQPRDDLAADLKGGSYFARLGRYIKLNHNLVTARLG